MKYTYLSHSLSDTNAIAARLASMLRGGEVLLLEGDLGAGKTTFVKGLALALGVTDTVTSPTFTLMNTYQGTHLRLYHFDLYRLGEEAQADMGFEEYYHAPDAVCCIEWCRADVFWGKVIRIRAEYVEGDTDSRRYSWSV